MSAANWIALVVPLLGLVGAAVLYGFQKSIDRKNQILSERRTMYREFISIAQDARVKVFMEPDGAPASWFNAYKSKFGELMVTAPDEVVEAAKDFDDTIRFLPKFKKNNSTADFKVKNAELTGKYAELVFQMRKDSFGKTTTTRASIEASIEKMETNTETKK